MRLIICSLLLALIASCAKPVQKVNKDFIGRWENVEGGEGYIVLQIYADGIGHYSQLIGSKTTTASGDVKIKGDQEFLLVGDKSFTIDKIPYEEEVDSDNDGEIDYTGLFMILDGIKYESN